MKFIVAGLAFVLTFACIFLMGAFIAVDFNIANWSADGRFMTMVVGLTLGAGSSITTANLKEFR